MSGIYTKFASSVLFPLHESLKGHGTVQARRHLELSQNWPRERLFRQQQSDLRVLLERAGENVPYYRRLFDAHALDAQQPLENFPFLTKAIIRENVESLKAGNHSDLTRCNTGGSTGEPLIFFLGNERVTHDVAAKWRATRWWSVDIGDPEIVLWGSPIELGAQDRVRKFRDKLLRSTLLPAFEMSERNLQRFVHAIRTKRPRMLFGYPSALAHIASFAEAKGETLDNVGIKVAFVTSERLYPEQRERIQRVFGCRVANGYGGRDGGFIAHECPEGQLHITAEDIVVETIRSDGTPTAEGEAGEIVVTHLRSHAFPFIRYRTGDVGILGREFCSCGRTLPILREIQGRTTDFIVAQDGTVLHGLSLIYILRDLPEIAAFKIVQESIDEIRVQLVVNAGFGISTEHAITSGFRARLGSDVVVVIEPVGSIQPEKSGKYRYVMSKVPSPYAN